MLDEEIQVICLFKILIVIDRLQNLGFYDMKSNTILNIFYGLKQPGNIVVYMVESQMTYISSIFSVVPCVWYICENMDGKMQYIYYVK